MGIDQNIDIGEQHPELPTDGRVTGFVLLGIERSGTIQINLGTGMDPPHGN